MTSAPTSLHDSEDPDNNTQVYQTKKELLARGQSVEGGKSRGQGGGSDDKDKHSGAGDEGWGSSEGSPGSAGSYEAEVRIWSSRRGYEEGEVVWYEGTYWRCEEDHPREKQFGPPNEALHLWTPTHSTSSYNPSLTAPTGTSFAPCSDLPLVTPQPVMKKSRAQAMAVEYEGGSHVEQSDSHEKDDSPDSAITVTHQNSRPTSRDEDAGPVHMPSSSTQPPQQHHGKTAFFAEKADEGIRYLALRHEKHKAGVADELRAELKGDRIFRLGGLGMWAYSGDPIQESDKEELWRTSGQELGREGWYEAAQKRTEYYRTSIALKPLIQWRLHTPTSGSLPSNALPIGYEGGDGAPLFAARAWYEGGLHLGKAGHHLRHGASISWGGAEITLDTYEVLCGPSPEEGGGGNLLKWMMFRHGETCGVEGWQPVEGGREKSGEVLLIGKGEWERGQHPGKVRIGDDHAHVPWGGGEVWVRPFQVLAYAHSVRR